MAYSWYLPLFSSNDLTFSCELFQNKQTVLVSFSDGLQKTNNYKFYCSALQDDGISREGDSELTDRSPRATGPDLQTPFSKQRNRHN